MLKYKNRGIKKGPCCYVYLSMGGGFFIVKSLVLYLVAICYVFLRMGAFFYNIKAIFAPYFLCRGFLLRLSPYGGLFSPFKGFSVIFSLCGGFFLCFLSLWGLFHNLKALLLRFSPFMGPFSPFKGLSATFLYYVDAFLLLLFSMWGCCFCFHGDPF